MKAFDVAMRYVELENKLIDNLDAETFRKVLSGTVDYGSLDDNLVDVIEEYVEFSNSQIVFA